MGSKAFLILCAALFIGGSILFCQTARGAAESSVLEVYPAPIGISPSSSTLEQATSWTSFSFAGSVTVQVTNNNPFTSARILPSHAQIIPAVNGNTVSFTLNQAGQFAVDFCTTGATCTEDNDTDLTNPMLVFANPIETDIPIREIRTCCRSRQACRCLLVYP
jgi:hypothetical protein